MSELLRCKLCGYEAEILYHAGVGDVYCTNDSCVMTGNNGITPEEWNKLNEDYSELKARAEAAEKLLYNLTRYVWTESDEGNFYGVVIEKKDFLAIAKYEQLKAASTESEGE